jgi:hypothetical protein
MSQMTIARRIVATSVALALAAAAGTAAWALSSRPSHDATAGTADLAAAAQVYAQMPAAQTPVAQPTLAAALQQEGTAAAAHGEHWFAGFDRESVDPRPCPAADPSQPCDLNQDFHLGGYGLGPTRVSTGPLVDGNGAAEHIYARAVALSDGSGQTLLLAAVENQGMFAADKQGPYGLYDIRTQVSQDTGVPIDAIVINTDHSHAGPDLIGLWGGVPVSYLQYVHDETVKALETAFAKRVPAHLRVGTDTPVVPTAATGGYVPGTATPGEYFDHSQFGPDTGPVSVAQQSGVPVPSLPSNVPQGGTNYPDDLVDTQLRVIQAYGNDGKPLGTLINYAAHGTVMDGNNLGYSADWPGRVAQATEQALHEPVAVTMVADVGRTQPPRPNSDPHCDTTGHVSCNVDKLDTYTRLFTPWVVHAVATAQAVTGSGIANEEVFTREVVTNPALLGVGYSGEVPARGFGAYRAATVPWFGGNVLGTFVSAHRLGNILFTAAPGEAYPDIRFGVENEVKGEQAAFTFGLANDQLGYLIAPASEYPWITYSQLGNDNSFFNVSGQYGDHVMCTQAAAAVAVGFTATGNASPYAPQAVQPNCQALTVSDALPMGPAPQQPWPFGDGVNAP